MHAQYLFAGVSCVCCGGIGDTGLLFWPQAECHLPGHHLLCVRQTCTDSLCTVHPTLLLWDLHYIPHHYWRPVGRVSVSSCHCKTWLCMCVFVWAGMHGYSLFRMYSLMCLCNNEAWHQNFFFYLIVFLFVDRDFYCNKSPFYMNRAFTIVVTSLLFILPMIFPRRIDFLKYAR